MPDQPNPRYETLVRIIDNICAEAPRNLRQTYRPPKNNEDKLGQAKDRAFCHLFLMVKFGIHAFEERELLITDGNQDGGLDAYYIDHENKKIYLIQSKFHRSGGKFESHTITAEDFVKMEIREILKGQKKDSQGNLFNEKILRFQAKLRKSTSDIYDPIVVLLANVRHNEAKIRKMLGSLTYQVFDHKKTYDELVFPLCTGTYNIPKSVNLDIYLSNKEQVRLKQEIRTTSGRCRITIIFAPTKEIGRVTSKYKNALLRYNPRNYLSLSKNPVNRGISDSIIDLATNDFAVFNNGITILADNAEFTDNTGSSKFGSLKLTSPQIINGGQTAYTLSKIYEEIFPTKPKIFDGKEVMLKVVSLGQKEGDRSKFIESISNSTNKQSRVKEADRRSNSKVLIEMQSKIYSHFGYFFERKEGEFFHGIDMAFLPRQFVIDRIEFLKAYLAYTGDPGSCRSKGEPQLFKHEFVAALFPNSSRFIEAFFAYRIFEHISSLEKLVKKKDYGSAKYGNGLRYGKYAIVAAVGFTYAAKLSGKENFDALAATRVKTILSSWKTFEKSATEARSNDTYVRDSGFDFDNYYKSKNMNADLETFFNTH